MFRLVWLLLELGAGLLREFARLPRRAADALRANDTGAATGTDTGGRRLVPATALAGSAGLAATLTLPGVTLVMSPSIDAWAVRPAPGAIRKGDLVQFSLVHPVSGPSPVSVTKYVLCMPGERLRISPPSDRSAVRATAAFFCNDTLIGVSLARGRGGVKLSAARIAGTVPPGFVYIGSSHPDGFDSRYFGLVRIDHLRRMERLF